MKNGGSFHSYVSLPEGNHHKIPLNPIKPPFSYGFPYVSGVHRFHHRPVPEILRPKGPKE